MKKSATEVSVQRRFNHAAFKFGILVAKDLLDDKKENALFSNIGAIDVAISLSLPTEKLKAGFVKKVDAAVRRLDRKKLDARTRRGLGI